MFPSIALPDTMATVIMVGKHLSWACMGSYLAICALAKIKKMKEGS